MGGVDLSSPLRSIAPGLDSAILEVLCRTESGLSATQIARLSPRGTRAGQLPVLRRLVDHGLVTAQPANTGFLYRLNRTHVLAPAVMAASGARKEILERLTAAIGALVPAPVHASLFGSFARGEADASSDLDLLLVTGDDLDVHGDDWTRQVRQLSDRVLAWTGNRLETLTLTRSRLAEVIAGREPVVDSWVSDSLPLLGSAIDMFVAASGGIAPDGEHT